jgi:hypothetical protein
MPEVVVRPRAPTPRPALMLRGESAPGEDRLPPRDRPVLSAEELRMLLGDDEPEGPAAANGAAHPRMRGE